MKILLIDNYDSFTFNLLQALGKMGASLRVFRNDAITLEEIADLSPDRIVVSPGPKRPKDAGISKQVIEAFSHRIPLLGVCLGMQCINEVFGGKTIRTPVCVHGKTTSILHHGKGLYQDLPSPFEGARYHSLMVDQVPECLHVESWTQDNIPMGIRHTDFPVVGLQFHPESFLTAHGDELLRNFMDGRF